MSSDANQRVAATVRAEMARRRIPQAQLAEALGMSQVAVSRRLNGQVPFSVPELDITASFLGVPMTLLITHEPAA